MNIPSTSETTTSIGSRAYRRVTARRRTRVAAACAALVTVVAAFSPIGAEAQVATPPLGRDRAADATTEQPDGGDPAAPSVALPPVIDNLEAMLARTPSVHTARQAALRAAVAELRTAIEKHTGDSSDIDAVAAALGRAAGHLAGVRPADDDSGRYPPERGQHPNGDAEARSLRGNGATMAAVARVLAVRVVELAARAGVGDPVDVARRDLAAGDAQIAAGDIAGGIRSYGKALAPKGALTFSMDLFESNVRNRIGPFVSGYAYTITQGGQIARESTSDSPTFGWARTSADEPATPHSPTQEQFLASVSKTITGVAMLRALQDTNISVDTSINAYLPANWAQGTNAGQLTFRHLLAHGSNICGAAFASCTQAHSVPSDWATLRTRISQAFPTLPAGYDYKNANFALMRILIPRVTNNVFGLPVGLADSIYITDADRAVVHAASFENYVRSQVFAPMGIDGRCMASEADPTLLYNFPHANQQGWDEDTSLLGCGGFGWYLSSRELGRFMSFLRYTETVLTTSTRKAMDAGALGWMDPAQWTWSTGAFGTYLNHGGDWARPPAGEAHTCIMKFHINVEIALVINSQETFNGHQCTALRNAFDQAWIAA